MTGKKETFYPADSYTADEAKNHYMSCILLWICESSKEWLLKGSREICDLLLIRRLMHPPLLMLLLTEAIAQAFFYCINFLCHMKLGSIAHVAALCQLNQFHEFLICWCFHRYRPFLMRMLLYTMCHAYS